MEYILVVFFCLFVIFLSIIFPMTWFENFKGAFYTRLQVYTSFTLSVLSVIAVLWLCSFIGNAIRLDSVRFQSKALRTVMIKDCMKFQYGMKFHEPVLFGVGTWETKDGRQFQMQTNAELKDCQMPE
jgi:hypothetical protein